MAESVADLLHEFHTRPGVDCQQPAVPTVLVEGALQRLAFIEEEVDELRQAVEFGDVTAAADALADIVYAVYGTAWRFGMPLDALVAEVHRSNMTKTPSPGDGKAIKGPGYSRPDIAGILRAATSETTS